jgi:hypothetical protein
MVEKTAAQKLGLKPGEALALLQPMPGWQAVLGPLPEGCRVVTTGGDVVLIFCRSRAELEAALPGLAAMGRQGIRLWVAYAKLTSPLATDVNRGMIHDLGPVHGLDTVAQIALDPDWTAMRLKLAG